MRALEQITSEKMIAAGKMATAARRMVGGYDINGFKVAPANVFTMADAAKALEEALDEYDRLVVEQAYLGKGQ
ncbi:hypothetical protein [Allorhizobium ampelinum]|uniref:hypothetical protein n=1 Tax=Allorhizobium ampelinum TaxID=3025782 RepID=UPI000B3F750C|nr:hypothetical protein [Allorhizobium ampelinum]NTA27371.1 hypothetical protein [Allorhizobium ampelinum]OVE94425.1 hypothetical protein B7W85_12810 [Allorhizobium ampelinum]